MFIRLAVESAGCCCAKLYRCCGHVTHLRDTISSTIGALFNGKEKGKMKCFMCACTRCTRVNALVVH